MPYLRLCTERTRVSAHVCVTLHVTRFQKVMSFFERVCIFVYENEYALTQ